MIPAAFAERFLWNSRKEEEIEPIVDSSPPPPADVAEQAKNLNKDEPDRITPAALPSFTFSDGVLAELNSFVSLAFSKAEVAQTTLLDATDDETAPVEKCVVLSCTQRHGTPILDAAVRYVAEKHKAEVLVLDAFEIASGKLGVLGKSGEVIDELYEAILSGERPSKETETEGSPPEDEVSGEPTNVRVGAQEEPKEQDTSVTTSSNSETKVVAVGPEDGKTEVAGGDNANLEGEVPESDPSVAGKEKVERREQEATETPSLDQRTRSLFDALLATSCSSSGKGDEETHPERRIVYMREFDIIQGAAKPLMAHILQSLHESRQRARLSGSHLPQNTIIVFGLNATPEVQLSIGNKPNSSQKNCLFLSGLFTSARSAISIKLHRSHYITCNCTACQVGRGTSPQVSLDNVPVGSDFWGERVDAMVAARLTMPVFSTNVKYGAYQEEWQKEGKRIRGRELNQRVLWACLERDGSVGFEKLESEVPDIESLNPDVTLEITDVDSLLTIAMGLRASAKAKEDSDNPVPSLKAIITEAYDIIQRRKKERTDWENGINSSDPPAVKEEPTEPEINFDDLSKHAEALRGCIINIDDISTTFSDVFVDEATVDSLQTIVTLPLLYPDYFNCGVLAKEAIGGILLYGPPGTGKTMLCRALAKTSHAKMLHIQPSDINDKYLGESEKKVAAVFELAYKLAPCIVFIDELDALFSSRSCNTESWEKNILTEFMQGMDGLKSAKKNRDNNIVIVGATNRPFDLDLAILRRMPRRILVGMPDLTMRKGILASYLKGEELHTDVSIDKLAMDTEGFSGSDLKNLCVAAALASVKEAIGPHWKSREKPPHKSSKIADKENTAGEGGNTESKDKDLKDEPKAKHPLRTITASNVRQARSDISKSVHGSRKDELYRWHEQHSNGGVSVGGIGTPAATPKPRINGFTLGDVSSMLGSAHQGQLFN